MGETETEMMRVRDKERKRQGETEMGETDRETEMGIERWGETEME